MPKPTFIPSAESRLIEQRMRSMQVGETLTYAEISEICGKPHDKVRYAVKTAKDHLFDEHDMQFHNVRGVGYRRSSDPDIVKESSKKLQKIRKSSKLTLRCQLKVDLRNPTPTQQRQVSAQASILGLISTVTKPAKVEALANLIEPGVRELPFAKTLKLFSATE